jgi:predicted Zn-dependent peptidase
VGASKDPVGKEGLCHLIEHMMFKQRVRGRSLADLFMDLKAIVNASTNHDICSFFVHIPIMNYKPFLLLVRRWLFDAKFTKNDYKNEKTIVLEEYFLRIQNTNKILKHLMQNRSRSYRDVTGTEKSIHNIRFTDVKAFYRKMFNDCRVVVSIDSKYFREARINTLKSLFVHGSGSIYGGEIGNASRHGPWAPDRYPSQCICQPSCLKSRIVVSAPGPNKKTSKVIIGFHGVCIHSKLFFAYEILSKMLGNFNGVLYKHMRVHRQLVYNMSVVNLSTAEAGCFLFSTQTSGDPISVIKEFFHAVNCIRKGRHRNVFKKMKQMHLFNFKTMIHDTLASSRATADFWTMTGTPDFQSAYTEGINAVTFDDILKCLHNLSQPYHVIVNTSKKQVESCKLKLYQIQDLNNNF